MIKTVITSVSNPLIVSAKKLSDKKFRQESGTALLEGVKFITDAFRFGMPIKQIFVSEDKYDENKDFIDKAGCAFNLISERVVKHLSESETSQGLFAEFDITKKLGVLKPPDTNFLVLDGLQDPGNVGTIIRTAAAAGYNTVYLINSVDIFSPKVIRSSAGTIFCINLYNVSYEKLLDIVKQNDLTLICADMKGENIYKFKKVLNKFGIVIGNEGNGVSDILKNECSITVSLPMKNNVESLNAGVSASILMYLIKEVK